MQAKQLKSSIKKTGLDIDKLIGEKIRQRRALLGLNQSDISSQLGITYQQFQKYEKGTSKVTASRLYMLARILDVDILYFYEDIDTKVAKDSKSVVPAESNYDDLGLKRLSKAYTSIEDDNVREAVLTFVKSFERKKSQLN